MKNKLNLHLINNLLLIIVLSILTFGRPLLGLYIFGYRIAEFFIGGCFIIYLLLIFYRRVIPEFKKEILLLNLLIIFYFVLVSITNNYDFTNTYIFRSSSIIWYISFIYLGYLLFSNINVKPTHFYIAYMGLLITYVLNVLYYPNPVMNFFIQNSDKFDYLKGAELSFFYITVSFFSNKYLKNYNAINIFVLFTSIYLPLIFFKSRSAGLAVLIFVMLQIYNKRKSLTKNPKNTFVVFIISIFLFSTSAHYIVDNTFSIKETDEAIAQVFKHKYVVSNTYDSDVSVFYFENNRLYSADGNLNWRLQLWQDIFINIKENNNILLGGGFEEKNEIFENIIYSTVDGSNENSHNFLINIYMKMGIVGLGLFFLFFYFLLKSFSKNFSRVDLFTYFFPLFLISMFDGSMENPYFGLSFYFFISIFITGLKFKEAK